MSEQNTSNASPTMKDQAWAAVLSALSSAYGERGEPGLQSGKAVSREEFFIPWSKGAGAVLISAWESASDTVLAEKVTKGPVPPIGGDFHMTCDSLIVGGGKVLWARNPELSEAQAVVKFLDTDDGKTLYAVSRAVGQGSRFEDHPNQMRKGLAAMSLPIAKGADHTSHPFSMQLHALMQASAK